MLNKQLCSRSNEHTQTHMLACTSINWLHIDKCTEMLTSCKSLYGAREILSDNHKTKYCKERGYHIQYS